MNAIEAAVREIAERMAASGAPPYQGWIAAPHAVWEHLRAERPEIAKSVVRHYGGSPQAQMGVWVPRVAPKAG
jgi:hypothetical protein